MFDYPTVADLTDFILSQFAPDDADDAMLAGGDLSATREPLSMLGLAGRYPGMSAQNDVSELLGPNELDDEEAKLGVFVQVDESVEILG